MPEPRDVASGLLFPEGPVALPDGSVLLTEIKRGTITKVTADGKVEVVAETGGGPNGMAIGPDGAAYVCNNGGFVWNEIGGILLPLDLDTGANEPPGFAGGRIERVDLDSGEVAVLYTECGGHRFRGPNDIVFDADGGFWFTDFGKMRARDADRGGVYYARIDGSHVEEVVYGLVGPNGVGLSPDGSRLYVAESYTGRLWQWELDGPGRVRNPAGRGHGGTPVVATLAHFDSLAVEADGTVVVAAINHGLCVVRPDASHEFVAIAEPLTTNICFGGPDLRTAYVTLSGTGRLAVMEWPRPGLRLSFQP